ncbi:MAG: Asp23/Gls24 family envelope stress response protein [Ruthenibacterium sp.]
MDINSSNVVGGSLQISTGVIAKIAKLATLEVEGVQAVSAGSHSVKGLFRTVSQYRPIVVEMTEDVAEITVNILVKYGCKIPPLAERVQENVKNAVQNMTQITVSRVNVVVAGLAPEQPEAVPEPVQEQ